MTQKLNIDRGIVRECRALAEHITNDLMGYIRSHTTDSVERSVVRLLGIDGADKSGTPYPNVFVEAVSRGRGLASGAAGFLADVMLTTGLGPDDAARAVAKKEISPDTVPRSDDDGREAVLKPLVDGAMGRIEENREHRERIKRDHPLSDAPLLYVIVATGNIHEDVVQAVSAAEMGADCIAVIRSTAQSLLDYVPYGPTTEGFGGTYATQENFRIMRAALDETAQKIGRYVYLVNYASGLCMPEISVMGAFERLDMLLNDSMYGIIFRDINPYRTFVDQHFSRMINARADIIINTGEDNYLTTADAFEAAHTVLASDIINEQFALHSHLMPRQMGLGHAFEIDPEKEDGFLLEMAQALLIREIFPDAPIKYMPPTKHVTGNIFQTHLVDMLFNVCSVMTGQTIHLVGMLTEAIHTPFVGDRYLSIKGARYARSNLKRLGQEIQFVDDGIIQRRAREVLKNAHDMLGEIADIGLLSALERGMFADIKRPPDGGKGKDGVVKKAPDYFNPFETLLEES
ncbi:MAG: lysine 5,6-aminomutase subunit alpha [Deltaproteobacteria bacterium]|nr:lysine 5,6-aminomutase subunit alpha [Candidatus Zymogenaceae bacterium]